jgi:hypothetical protein
MSLSKILGLMQTRIKKAIDLTEKGTITVFILLILIILLFTIVPPHDSLGDCLQAKTSANIKLYNNLVHKMGHECFYGIGSQNIEVHNNRNYRIITSVESTVKCRKNSNTTIKNHSILEN